MQAFLDQEEKMIRDKVDLVLNSNANVVFCQKGIDDLVQYYLSKEKIYACRRVAKSDMENLAKATGGKIISNINELSEGQLGNARLVEEVKQGDEGMTYVRGCMSPKALTILIHGGSDHVIDEMEREKKEKAEKVTQEKAEEKATKEEKKPEAKTETTQEKVKKTNKKKTGKTAKKPTKKK